MMALWAWYAAHQAIIYSVASTSIVVIDWLMGRNANLKANGVLHWVEIELRQILGLPPQQ